MARVTSEEVQQIMDSTDMVNDDFDSFIETANALVTSTLGSSGLGATMLMQIEKWLTAHLIVSTRERMAKKEGVADANVEYLGTFGEGLKSTPYGQMVETLDSTGEMSKLGGRGASIYAITSFE